jgi:branched-chain amino acid transport system ATP-binding protein
VSELTVTDLSVAYNGRPAVRDVTLSVPAAAITALLGPNGAGKTSLVRALGGVTPARRGRLTVGGTSVPLGRPDRIRRAGVAIVLEGHRVLGDLSVEANLRVATGLLKRAQRTEALAQALELFPELGRLQARKARLLSGGEQQMLALAQAICSQPRYLVVDEMSLGLAPLIVRRLGDAITLVTKRGVGVLLIEQFTALALEVATHTYVMNRGQIKFSGPPRTLLSKPEVLETAYLAEAAVARIPAHASDTKDR